MKPRIRSLHNLFHRWGHNSKLDAKEIALRLWSGTLIEYVYFNDRGEPTHYKETQKMFDIPEQVFNETILKILKKEK